MKKNSIIVALIFIASIGYAQTGNTKNYGKFKSTRTAAQYDSLLSQMYERNSSEAYNRFYNEFINIDPSRVDMSGSLSDEVYEQRLRMMATEIQLPYNSIVKSYINVYTRKSMAEVLLGRAQYYFPIFEEALYRHNLPMELKILPVVESALIPKVESHASAMGLWQFIPSTAKQYGLEINSFVDERCDPAKSTEAACRYLKDLYRIYDDWTLVMAAYNCGSGRVNKALAKVPNASNYWEIYEHLPSETRGYVPAFIAASYAYTYHKAHDMTPRMISHPFATDTIMINRMMHFEQVSSTLDIPLEVLRHLNPQYRIDIIPAIAAEYPLVLPQSEISKFINREQEILSKDTAYLAKYLKVTNIDQALQMTDSKQLASNKSKQGTKTTYKVKNGDTLGAIAKRHKVKVSDIQSWNKIKGTNIKQGQNLIIYRR